MKKIINVILTILLITGCSINNVDNNENPVLKISTSNIRYVGPSLIIDNFNVVVTNNSDASEFYQDTFEYGSDIIFYDLKPGSWNIYIEANNISGDLIGSGTTDVDLSYDVTTNAEVTIDFISDTGLGALELYFDIPVDLFTTLEIEAQLLSAPGAEGIPITFNVVETEESITASYSSSEVPVGNYILELNLYDLANGFSDKKSGFVDVVSVLEGVTTSHELTPLYELRGDLDPVNISYISYFDLTLDGSLELTPGDSTTLSATATTDDAISYIWYLNGDEVGTESSITIGDNLPAGDYYISVVGHGANSFSIESAILSIKSLDPTLPENYSGELINDSGTYTLTITWDMGSDDNTKSRDLEYKLVSSTDYSRIDTVEEANSITGEELLVDWSSQIYMAERTITDLTTTYDYYNVLLVRDTDGNITMSDTIKPPICVSTEGSDSGLGLSFTPYLTIEKAVEMAKSQDVKEIWLESGFYTLTQTVTIDSDISILGGYSNQFEDRSYMGSNIEGTNSTTITSSGIITATEGVISLLYYPGNIGGETILEGINFEGTAESQEGDISSIIHIKGSPTIQWNVLTAVANPGDNSVVYITGETAAPQLINNEIRTDFELNLYGIYLDNAGTSESYTLVDSNYFIVESGPHYSVSSNDSYVKVTGNTFEEGGELTGNCTNIYVNNQSVGDVIITNNTFNISGSSTSIEIASGSILANEISSNEFTELSTYYSHIDSDSQVSDLGTTEIDTLSGSGTLESFSNILYNEVPQ